MEIKNRLDVVFISKKFTVLLAICFLILCTACGASSRDTYNPPPVAPDNVAMSSESNVMGMDSNSSGIMESNQIYYDEDFNYNDQDVSDIQETLGNVSENTSVGQMIIRNAYMEIEVQNINEFYDNIISFIRNSGGYESSYNIDNNTFYSIIKAEVRIPANEFDNVIKYIRDTGTVINEQMLSENITDTYFDTQTRLETTRSILQTYYNLLENVSEIEDIIRLQRIIDGITVEIEAMEGRLRVWSSQSSFSTLNLSITQYSIEEEVEEEIEEETTRRTLDLDDMLNSMVSGFINTLDIISRMIQVIIIIIASVSPVLLVLAILYFAIKKFGSKLKHFKNKIKDKLNKRKFGSEDNDK